VATSHRQIVYQNPPTPTYSLRTPGDGAVYHVVKRTPVVPEGCFEQGIVIGGHQHAAGTARQVVVNPARDVWLGEHLTQFVVKALPAGHTFEILPNPR
jgi:hypothetical protein